MRRLGTLERESPAPKGKPSKRLERKGNKEKHCQKLYDWILNLKSKLNKVLLCLLLLYKVKYIDECLGFECKSKHSCTLRKI